MSHLALPEMLRLFFISGLLFCRNLHGAVAACFHALRNSSGSLVIFTASAAPSSVREPLRTRRRPCRPPCATVYRFSKKHPHFLDAATLSTPYLAEIEEH